jgi:beta-aspartyl-peptidase (threonine type)
MNVIMLHGGVETPTTTDYRNILQKAARCACQNLAKSPLTALEAAINLLEDHPLFNAGYGSVLNAAGEVEMDAAICDGKTGRFGAVGAIQNVANPVSVARKVLEESPHVLLVGPGAERFAHAKGFPKTDCISAEMRHSWEQAVQKAETGLAPVDVSLLTGLPVGTLHAGDTVGGLLCHDGDLYAASSTGGSFLKLPGRIGDTPVLGGGILASKNAAVVCTGIGEAFIETLTASYVQHLLGQGILPQAAAEKAINRLSQTKRLPGGIIVLNSSGAYGAAYNSYSFPVSLLIDGRLVDFEPVYCPIK